MAPFYGSGSTASRLEPLRGRVSLSQGFLLGGLKFQFLWDLIFLRKFSYRNKFIQMNQVAYINIQPKIKINGLLSDSFALIQEFHQGCPHSMLLWIIVAEVLAVFIDANTKIKGIQIGDHEIKIVNFAYDTTIFLRHYSGLELILALSQNEKICLTLQI